MAETGCPECGGPQFTVEYAYGSPQRYDGVSEYRRQDDDACGVRVGRWSGKRLAEGEEERRFGGEA
jgi:hypothetical protein